MSGSPRLVDGVFRLGQRAGQKGGEKTGSNPVYLALPGSKRHLLVDGNGTPLAAVLTGAQVHDSKVFEELVDGVEPIEKSKGHPRKSPDELHADKGYDETTRAAGSCSVSAALRLGQRDAVSTRARGEAITAGSWSAR